jgi:hypothetical protein
VLATVAIGDDGWSEWRQEAWRKGWWCWPARGAAAGDHLADLVAAASYVTEPADPDAIHHSVTRTLVTLPNLPLLVSSFSSSMHSFQIWFLSIKLIA